MTARHLVAAAIVLAMAAGCVFAQPWPRFRGPNGEGTSEATTIPTTWTTADYNWRVRLPGVGQSSPVVWGGQIFVTSATDDATQFIRCLSTSDGGLIWKRQFPSQTYEKNALTAYASATPALDEKRVYTVWATPEHYVVLSLDRENGRDLWRRDLGPYLSQHGFGSSPIVWGDMVVINNDQDGPSSVVALDCETGETRWETSRRSEKAGYATACICQPEDGPAELVLASWAHGVFSLDPRTGRPNWELGVFKDRVVGSPVICGGLIWAGAGTGGAGKRYVGVRPGGGDTPAELVNDVDGRVPYVPTAVTYGDLLFLWSDQGEVACLDAASGKVRWRERVRGGGYFGSPVRVADRLYCMSRKGEMVVLAAADQFQELARINLEEPTSATPAVADGVMYLRTASHLMAIGGEK